MTCFTDLAVFMIEVGLNLIMLKGRNVGPRLQVFRLHQIGSVHLRYRDIKAGKNVTVTELNR